MKNKSLYLLMFVIVFMVLVLLPGCKQHEHSYGKWSVEKAATCTEQGIEIRSCECGEKQTQIIEAKGHDFDGGTVATEATCAAEGLKVYNCAICQTTKKEPIAKPEHQYNEGVITTAATCAAEGLKVYTCAACQTTKNETIAKPEHQYNQGVVTTAETCTTDGVKTFTCQGCGVTRTETIAKLGHSPNSNYVCTRCYQDCPVDLNMSSAEISDAKKIRYIAERSIDNLEDEKQFRLMFSFKDGNEGWLKVPAVVKISIANKNGETVYQAVKLVKTSDFSGWSNGFGKRWTAAAIYIPYSDITPGSSKEGTVSFKVYNDYCSFDTSTLNISSGLPIKSAKIILPSVPVTIHDYDYNDKIDSSVKITGLTYEIKDDDLYVYVSGQKTYDAEGSRYSQSCKVGWKLYDGDGYIIDSGTFYSPQIAVGEKFRDESIIIWSKIVPGQTCKLKISSVD